MELDFFPLLAANSFIGILLLYLNDIAVTVKTLLTYTFTILACEQNGSF